VVEVRTDEPEQRFAVGATLGVRSPCGEPAALTVQAARRHGGRLVVRFEGIADRSAAESLRGALLTVDRSELPPVADPEEFYDHQLVGLAVALSDGRPIGTVADILHGPGGDLLVVARDGASDALVPFVHQIVPIVDVTSGRIVVDPPEGLLDPS
jgi:16S rRNA processing protein RimM